MLTDICKVAQYWRERSRLFSLTGSCGTYEVTIQPHRCSRERLGVAMFQGSVSSRRPNSLLVLVTIFIVLMTVSIYQVSNIALQDHDLMNDLEYVRLKEEHSKKGNALLPKDFWAHDNVHDATFSRDQEKVTWLVRIFINLVIHRVTINA